MDKQGQVETESGQSSDFQQQVQQVRELFADAPELAKTALENVLREIESGEPSSQPATRIEPVDGAGAGRLLVGVLLVRRYRLQLTNMLAAHDWVNIYDTRCRSAATDFRSLLLPRSPITVGCSLDT